MQAHSLRSKNCIHPTFTSSHPSILPTSSNLQLYSSIEPSFIAVQLYHTRTLTPLLNATSSSRWFLHLVAVWATSAWSPPLPQSGLMVEAKAAQSCPLLLVLRLPLLPPLPLPLHPLLLPGLHPPGDAAPRRHLRADPRTPGQAVTGGLAHRDNLVR